MTPKAFFRRLSQVSTTALLLAGVWACTPENTVEPTQEGVAAYEKIQKGTATQATITENFEAGVKTSYTTGNVALSSGSWEFNDALVGDLSTDMKSGTKSARIRNSGRLTMLFNKSGGIGTVTIKHAKFGTDANSTWELWVSANNGSSWTKVGSTVTTSSSTLVSSTFTVNLTTARLQLRKTDATTSRLNIDDVTMTDYSSSGGGTTPPPTSSSVHLTMGNPSNAVTDAAVFGNYLLQKNQYAMSYHRDRGVPNWVSWHLASEWIGSTPRQDDFRPDNTLPTGWYQVTNTDYTGSGFDRGHNCPSADRTATVTDNSSTFLMTNMMPQAPDNNQGPWQVLETYCRTLVSQGNELYIIAGSYGVGGTGSNGTFNTITGGKVTVPNRTWKVIVVLPKGDNDVARVTTATRVIAIDMPNAQGIRNNNWGTYRVSVDAIESRTGYNILSALPTSVQDVIEARVDAGATQ